MFFVLRRVIGDPSPPVFLSSRSAGDGDCRTTSILNEAKLFKLNVAPDHENGATSGRIVFVGGSRIPADLPGRWEIVQVDLRLAEPS